MKISIRRNFKQQTMNSRRT